MARAVPDDHCTPQRSRWCVTGCLEDNDARGENCEMKMRAAGHSARQSCRCEMGAAGKRVLPYHSCEFYDICEEVPKVMMEKGADCA